MKGVPGILIAIGLGLTGALLNWFYLERLSGQQAKVQFVGIKPGTQLNVGDVIGAEHVVAVGIPKSGLGNLDSVAPRWDVRGAVIGMTTSRSFRGGEVVLHDDLTTPGTRDLTDRLGKDEVAVWLPVDPRTFNPGSVNPGDEVSFIVPRTGGEGPTPRTPPPSAGVPSSTGASEIVGPFRILQIGNRTGRPEVQRATGARGGNETSLTVVAKLQNGRLEPKAERITEVIRQSRSLGLQVLLHPNRPD